MTPDETPPAPHGERNRHARARDLFLATLELAPERRSSYLDLHCGDDPELRREIESLLDHHDAESQPPPASVSADESPTVDSPEIAGRYRVLDKLGAGGMGEVFLARDLRLGRRVALKALHPDAAGNAELRRRLESEARLLAALHHPHVAALFGIEESDDRLYLVLEHVEGETLARRLGRGALPVSEALATCAQIAAGLEAAHGAGVIHRDLKPSNVMLTPDGTAKVLDFGLARPTAVDSRTTTALDAGRVPTETGVILGTVAYMSPEQARGRRVDPTTDTWALGCVLYECLTGSQAFSGETMSDSIARILEGEPDWSALPAGLPPSARNLLRRCLAKDSRRRLQHPGDARIELEEATGGQEVEAGQGSQRAPGPASRWAALALAAAAFAAGWLVPAPWDDSGEPPRAATRRYSVTLPADSPVALAGALPLGVGRTSLALSPDGSQLVYVTQRNGTTRLALRPLASFETTLLAETEGGFSPFFSPDGEWVAFFTEGLLRRVPVAGGSALTVTEARNPFGGAWAENGTIHFAEAEGRALVSVAPDGTDRRERRPREVNWPQMIPGGNLLAGLPVGVIEPDTLTLHPLVEGTFARYLAGGQLIFGVDGALFAAPFDPGQPDRLGTPIALSEPIRSEYIGAFQLAVSATGVAAYVPGSRATPGTIVRVRRGESPRTVIEGEREYGSFSLSPDRRRIALAITSGGSDIWIYEVDRGSLVRLTQGGTGSSPVWSPDGSEIYVCEDRRGASRAWVYRADGSGTVQPLFPTERPGCVTDAAPDGRWLVLDRFGREESNWDVAAIDRLAPETLVPIATSPAYEWGATVSPDGLWVAYTSDSSGRYEAYVQAFPKAETRWQISDGGGEEPTWTAEGDLLYRNGQQWMRVRFEAGDPPRLSTPLLELEGDFLNVPGHSYRIAGDGELLMIARAAAPAPTEVRIIENWIEELAR